MEQIAATRFVGSPIKRREDPRLLSGHGRYVDDVRLPGLLHAAFVRSPFAHAEITGIRVTEARALPGVRAVFTHDDVDALTGDRARYVGDPIVIVVAESRARAEDAAELVEVDYEPLPAVVDLRDAAESGVLVHEDKGTNVASASKAPDEDPTEALFAGAAHVVTELLEQHRYLPVPMETRGVVADWQPHGDGMTVWISTQGAHAARDHLADALGLPSNHVRVIAGDVGGGFGLKIAVGREETAAVLAARLLAEPVKWIEDRWENLVAANHARVEQATVSLALDTDGTMLALRVHHLDDVGAYGSAGGGGIVRFIPGPYRFGAVTGSSTSVFTNTMKRGAYRGPWMYETVVRETIVDIAARALDMDPLELRRRNVITATDLPYTAAGGMVYDIVTPAETLEQAAELIDYEGFRREQEAARADGRYLGLGIASFIEPSAYNFGAMATEAVTIRIEPSGTVLAITGANSQGHSIETTLAQVIADHLGVDIDDIVVRHGDTASSPFGAVTGGSRNAVFGGGAARQAALEMRERVVQIAAHLMEASPADMEIVGGRVGVRGTPATSQSLAEIAQVAYNNPSKLPEGIDPGLEIASRFMTGGPTFSNATHICTCEVDLETGQVQLLRYVVSEDCGVIINPLVVEGQIAGGVTQGIGGALLEHFVYDEEGNPLTTTFLDYLLPTAADVPEYEYGHIETASARPGGFKGMGEGGAIGAPAAVFNAVADALAPLGVRLTRQPLTPPALLEAIAAARAS